jgi:hypothetical protein
LRWVFDGTSGQAVFQTKSRRAPRTRMKIRVIIGAGGGVFNQEKADVV